LETRDLNELLQKISGIAKDLKISRGDALLLLVFCELKAIHDHINEVRDVIARLKGGLG